MSERKVLQKYYPPDFDPSLLSKRVKKPRDAPPGPKAQTVRLMAPFSMKCLNCGEFIYKGRKFNARKEHTQEKYYSISIFRFYIRCTRCSSEITFKTDPKNMDYDCEKGAVRNFEPWRKPKEEMEETDEQRLDRLEREEKEMEMHEAAGGRVIGGIQGEDGDTGAMERLEAKTVDSKREMAIADALDEIRTRNARNERAGDIAEVLGERGKTQAELERERQEKEDEELAKKAFQSADDGKFVRRLVDDDSDDDYSGGLLGGKKEEEKKPDVPEVPSFKKTIKRKRDLGAALGIKKKAKPLV
ncbi:DUF572-domain-containing protein [Ascodesmis nigricans]|uniref:Splicing factor YJU2 n=1 Tax=Ascodesmis nigricans TaxID=341454 RepID=A0A4S2N525_9PEZI|nr:DUF572-domain-containing protein [Ascodesmis nigricans]